MKKTVVIIGLVLTFLWVFTAGISEGAITGYDSESGFSYLLLGSYPQWMEGGNPPEKAWVWSRNKLKDNPPQVDPSPLLWRVLHVEDNEAILLSEYVLFAHPMHTNITEYKTIGTSFANTQLSHYLNDEFLSDAFTTDERDLLTPDDSGCLVTLLTAKQLNDKSWGLGTDATRKAWATEYAIRVTDVFVYQVGVGQHSPYWVQDQSVTDIRHARCTKQSGAIGHIVSDRDNEGVRPVVRINLLNTQIVSGDGSLANPYTLSAAKE